MVASCELTNESKVSNVRETVLSGGACQEVLTYSFNVSKKAAQMNTSKGGEKETARQTNRHTEKINNDNNLIHNFVRVCTSVCICEKLCIPFLH